MLTRNPAVTLAQAAPVDADIDPRGQVAAESSQPVFFGRPERPLFGWFHAGRIAGARAAVGLVICNPFGDEAIRTHRSMRHLAEGAAASGIPTLRFDYDGTGNSAGHDLDPERVREWLGSVRLAVQALREWTGIERVCFAGVRLGALLATLVAYEDRGTAGLAAIAPVVNGRAYVRELRLLRRAIEAKRNIAQADGDGALEAAGFLLTAPTQDALGAIHLAKLGGTPAPRVLIVDRSEMPLDQGWAEHLRSHGALVEHERLNGYPEMMLDAHESVVPDDMIRRTLDWLRDVAAAEPHATRGPAVNPTRNSATLAPPVIPDPVTGSPRPTAIGEWAVRLAGTPRLFGIVSAPADRSFRTDATSGSAVLMLNAGAVHHIGPCRLYVALARHLAQLGHVVLRLDIRGIGDSPPRPGQPENVVYAPHALEDVAAAIDYLRQDWGVEEIRIVGLCSGAYHALKAAVAQYPLRGIISINPLTFFWKPGMSLDLDFSEHRVAQDIMRYRSSALSVASWHKLLTGRVDMPSLARVLARTACTQLLKPLFALARLLRIPLLHDLPTELARAANADIDLQFVFAAADPGVELLQTHGGATARRLQARGRLGVHLIADADHTFTDLAPRIKLVETLERQLSGQGVPG